MHDEHDPKRHTVYRFDHAGIMSAAFTSYTECTEAAKAKLLAYPAEPAIIYTSTEVMTVEDVTRRVVYPWYSPVDAVPMVSPPSAADEPSDPVVDERGLEII